ncbi:MAG TPA: hypothetical protein VM532_14285, partial [Burkholderiales bacterium]|nr:hypothetical protein [Burkholderiales bacterium]
MKSKILRLMALSVALTIQPLSAQTRIDIGGSFDDGPLRNFHLSIGEHYHVPEREIVVIRERRLPEPELPVVFYIAERARVAPESIVNLRLSGRSWMDITLHFGLSPEIYYVPVSYDPGPPYGNAYGYWRKNPRSKWKRARFRDADIIELVNVKFISKHYGYSPDAVVRARSSGREFVVIN